MRDGCVRWNKKGSVMLSCCPQVNIALPCYSLGTSQPRCQGSGLLPVPIEREGRVGENPGNVVGDE